MNVKGEDMCMTTIMNSENMYRLFKVEYISFRHISALEKWEMFSEYGYSALEFFFFLRNWNGAI